MVLLILSNLLHAYSILILVYCVCSWIPGAHGPGIVGDIYRVLGKIVGPYLNLFRKIIPPIGGTIDISPILAMIVLEIIGRLLIRTISMFIVF